MRQKGRELDLTGGMVDGGGLDRGYLMLAKGLADDIKPAGERGLAEGPIPLHGKRRAYRCCKRFFGVAELALGLGERCGNRADGLTGAVHRRSPLPRGRS